MEQVGLVEEHALAGGRMPCGTLTDLRRAQSPIREPQVFDRALRANLCQRVLIVGSEDLLPGDIDTRVIVAHVPDSARLEQIQQITAQGPTEQTHVGERSFSTDGRRLQATESEFQRPLTLVRVLVVQGNFLGRRIVRRRENTVPNRLTWGRAVEAIEAVRGQGCDQSIELLHVGHREPSEQQGAVLRELRAQVLQIILCDAGQIELASARLDQ